MTHCNKTRLHAHAFLGFFDYLFVYIWERCAIWRKMYWLIFDSFIRLDKCQKVTMTDSSSVKTSSSFSTIPSTQNRTYSKSLLLSDPTEPKHTLHHFLCGGQVRRYGLCLQTQLLHLSESEHFMKMIFRCHKLSKSAKAVRVLICSLTQVIIDMLLPNRASIHIVNYILRDEQREDSMLMTNSKLWLGVDIKHFEF